VTTPHEEQPATAGPAGGSATPEQAAAGVPGTPRVTTAPPRARWRFGRVPARLGRARTSTVALAVVWLLVALLWLDVRPPSAQIAPTGDTSTGTVSSAPTTAPARTSSSAPTTAPSSSAPSSGTTTTPSVATSTAPATRTPGTSASATSAAPTRTSPGIGGTPALPTTGGVPTS
jgi:cytoskeletal protein RodZ